MGCWVLEPIRITLNPVASLCSTNPLLGCAFAAPFGKGGRQTQSGWRGDFCLPTYSCGVIRIVTELDFIHWSDHERQDKVMSVFPDEDWNAQLACRNNDLL